MNNQVKLQRGTSAATIALGLIAGVTAAVAAPPKAAVAQKTAAPKVATAAKAAAPKTVNADAIATSKIHDMTTTLTVQEIDRSELQKIGGAFATSYSIKHVNVAYQYPNRARFDGRVLGAQVLLVYNGDQKMFRALGQHKIMNVAGQPGQKQTLMDMGIFAKDYLTTDYAPTFVKMEDGLPVFKLSQRNSDNNSHEIVTVDPKTSLIVRRLSYNGENKLIKELRFKNPVQVRPGIWVPTRLEIYNGEGKFGVAQSLDDTKVNLGVDNDLFSIS